MIEEIKKRLTLLATNNMQVFSNKLIKNSLPILGVKLPELRRLAKEICKTDYEAFLKEYDESSFELQMLYAYVISSVKMDIEKRLEYLIEFVPKIKDWAVCDGLVSSLKCTKKYPEEMWNLLLSFENSHKEFEVRFVAVMLFAYYLTDDYVASAIQIIKKLDISTYYAKMGVAWFIATLMIQYKAYAFQLLEEIDDPKVISYTIRKVKDSYRIPNSVKEEVSKFKK